jgi:glycosyltransferase involved in cell wall biosynthesis
MYNAKKISLILPTYNEKDSIRKVIEDFENLKYADQPLVDEILVINNNAAPGTSEEVACTSAIEIVETKQGYGAAIICGFRNCSGDLVVVCEPDDTFLAEDIFKLLSYSGDVDIVYGSRTVQEFILTGANMGTFLRWGNWSVAKMMEVLFNTNQLSDVGCTYRLINKTALTELLPGFMVQSNFFGPEMMLRGYLAKYKCVQIPIRYKERVGESSVTGDLKKAFYLGCQMIFLIFAVRFKLDKYYIKWVQK